MFARPMTAHRSGQSTGGCARRLRDKNRNNKAKRTRLTLFPVGRAQAIEDPPSLPPSQMLRRTGKLWRAGEDENEDDWSVLDRQYNFIKLSMALQFKDVSDAVKD